MKKRQARTSALLLLAGLLATVSGTVCLTGCEQYAPKNEAANEASPEDNREPDVAHAARDAHEEPPLSIAGGDAYMRVFHVSPDGDDANAGTAEAPFRTAERARDAVRGLTGEMTGDVLIAFHPGDYVFEQPLRLAPEDSGRDGHTVIYRGLGEPGSARLLGAQRVRGWREAGSGVFVARLGSADSVHTLYENGIRARKARYPNYEYDARFPLSDSPYLIAEEATSDTITWKRADLDALGAPEALETALLVFWPFGTADWHKATRKIIEIDAGERRIIMEDENPRNGPGSRYFFKGAKHLLDAPGEFYHDAQERLIYYWPRFGHPDEQEIRVPHLNRIVSLEGGNGDNPVRKVAFEGFEAAYTDGFEAMEGSTMFPWSITSSGAHGIFHLKHTEGVQLNYNHLHSSGMNGIYLERSNKRNRIYGNRVDGMGISGIVLAYHREARQYPGDINEGNLIENNLIRWLGMLAVDSAGINIWGASDNEVRHCVIEEGARYGISMRGPFTQLSPTSDRQNMGHTNRPFSEGNRIAYTHIRRVGQDSGDMGAVHMAGISSRTRKPVNTLEQLVIEDIRAHPSMLDMAPNGIYFDYTEGVVNQVVRNIDTPGTPGPFRSNRTTIGHVFENCSWLAGFEPARMEYEKIGLLPDFPEAYRPLAEPLRPVVRNAGGGRSDELVVAWEWPDDERVAGVWVTAEGEREIRPVFAAAGTTSVRIQRPDTEHLVSLRIQSAAESGRRSRGMRVPAAEIPPPVEQLRARGTGNGFVLNWKAAEGHAERYRVTFPSGGHDPVELPGGARSTTVRGLPDARVFRVELESLDARGHAWPVGTAHAVTGGPYRVPRNPAAAWTFDANAARPGKVLAADARMQALEVEGGVSLVDGKMGEAVQFTRGGDALRLPMGKAPAIGEGGYAVSLWAKTSIDTPLGGRLIDFGGGFETWEAWAAEAPDAEMNPPLGGINIGVNPYSIHARFHDGARIYSLRSKGLRLGEQWRHIVLNIDRTGLMSFWLDGEMIERQSLSSSSGGKIRAVSDLCLGRHAVSGHPALMWRGAVDQARIYQRALTREEILALFEEGL